jgi:hypothetical protein
MMKNFISVDMEHISQSVDHDLLIKGINKLSQAVKYDETTNVLHDGKCDLIGLMSGLQMIETAKINLLFHMAREILEKNNRKVIICVNYLDTVNDLMFLLSTFSPMCLTGQMNYTQQMKIVSQFRNNCVRVLIVIRNVYDDLFRQLDGSDVQLLVSPTHKQFYHHEEELHSTIQFVFCKETESKIFEAIIKRSSRFFDPK